jgi:hypothetical protein
MAIFLSPSKSVSLSIIHAIEATTPFSDAKYVLHAIGILNPIKSRVLDIQATHSQNWHLPACLNHLQLL